MHERVKSRVIGYKPYMSFSDRFEPCSASRVIN